MQYKIFVFDDVKNIDLDRLCRALAMQNCSISCLHFENELLLDKILQDEANFLLVCKNEDIDQLICKNINLLSNQKQIVDDMAVVFEKNNNKIVFLPLEELGLLEKIDLNPNRPNKQCVFKLFGLSKEKVCQILEPLKNQFSDLQYSVFESQLRNCEVYVSYTGTSDLIDDCQVQIATAFKDFVYSDNSLSLCESVAQLAKLKGLKFCICEGVSGGLLTSTLCQATSNPQEVVSQAKVEFCLQPTDADTIYKQTLTLLNDRDNELAINVQGQFEDDQFVCVYAIGNNKSIDMHKNTYRFEEKNTAVQFALNAIMFNIIKKLRQNNLAF